jgi:2-polyprenyl-3-methyl-5-hydroxy-6-metoxy-1,4-benzoquinol methylase
MKTWSTPVREIRSGIIPCVCCGSKIFAPFLECEGFGYVRCNECGLVQMNPQPLTDEIIARYSSVFGKNYLSYEIENENAFLKLQQYALKDARFFRLEKALMLNAKSKPAILDIGCATGALLLFLEERGWHVTGVEISPAAEYARNVHKLDVRSLPLEEIKFPCESFDVVLASHLIEHLNNPFSFLSEIRRILKKDGAVFITTPNISGFQARLYRERWRSAIFDHLYLFSKRTLKNIFIKTGFKTKRIRTWGGLAAGLAFPLTKKCVDFFAKLFNFGDVMVVYAQKFNFSVKPKQRPNRR